MFYCIFDLDLKLEIKTDFLNLFERVGLIYFFISEEELLQNLVEYSRQKLKFESKFKAIIFYSYLHMLIVPQPKRSIMIK